IRFSGLHCTRRQEPHGRQNRLDSRTLERRLSGCQFGCGKTSLTPPPVAPAAPLFHTTSFEITFIATVSIVSPTLRHGVRTPGNPHGVCRLSLYPVSRYQMLQRKSLYLTPRHQQTLAPSRF